MKTILIAGINGDIGKEFAKRLLGQGKLYGLSRKETPLIGLQYHHIQADLLKPNEIKTAFEKIEPSEELVYIHLPGKFQFEDKQHPITDGDGDGIDDNIFKTNFRTFLGAKPVLREYLIKNPQAKLKLVGMGSTSDLYNVQLWHSFTESKNKLRQEFRAMYGDSRLYGRVSSLFINVSTTAGTQLKNERPFIPKKYLLTPREILDQSLAYILDERAGCVEISILKPNPEFDGFNDHKKTKKRWYDEMYGKNN
ncbi:hypothetical protein HOD38_05190 [archaeon]|jgi:NAD(P)-dependent dehydrogenase (short-subunit alcohol dehydrogenase family)|nr:hypothetical protein [archaeon]MBT4397634.1 hypothetical protein [archaeon]